LLFVCDQSVQRKSADKQQKPRDRNTDRRTSLLQVYACFLFSVSDGEERRGFIAYSTYNFYRSILDSVCRNTFNKTTTSLETNAPEFYIGTAVGSFI
jgi:hypothetical protein